jgi:hypothetical protein
VRSQIRFRSGKKPQSFQEIHNKLRSVPINKRQTLRDFAKESGVSVHSIRRFIAIGSLKRVITRIKPSLTEKNKETRMNYAFRFINQNTLKFDPMYNVVHIDEKWFNADREKISFLVLEDEKIPERDQNHKSHIPKVMFLAAQARPR